jgi:hypothetical protein
MTGDLSKPLPGTVLIDKFGHRHSEQLDACRPQGDGHSACGSAYPNIKQQHKGRDMTNALTKQEANAAYVARYDAPGTVNPYAAFATESGGGIVGRLVACKKGDWSIGKDGDQLKEGTRFLIVVPTMRRGWVKFGPDGVVDRDMGLVADNFLVKHRHALGDLDEALWEKGPDGSPRDPWARNYSVQMVEMAPPHGDATFVGSSFGAHIMLQEVCRTYAAEMHAYPDQFPVMGITTKTRQSKSFGPIKDPWLDLVGWASVDDVRSGKKAAAGAPGKAKAGDVIRDEVPDWSVKNG